LKPRLSSVAAGRLNSPLEGAGAALDAPLAEDDVIRVLARIARTGKPGDRLPAAELIGKHLGPFKEEAERGVSFAELVADACQEPELSPDPSSEPREADA
jgi:hypothetical protein